MSDLKYVRLFAGPDGESHFEDLDVQFSSSTATPPTPQLGVSEWQLAERIRFVRFPPGWRNEYRAPILLVLSGTVGIQTSDGEVRFFQETDALLAEDTTGKGHTTWNHSDDTAVAAMIQLRD